MSYFGFNFDRKSTLCKDDGWSFIFNERIVIIMSYSYEIDFNTTYYKQGIRI